MVIMLIMDNKYIKAYKLYEEDPFITINDLERQFNFSKSSFYRFLKKENLELPKKAYFSTASKEKLNKSLELYKIGHSIIWIADNLHMSEKTIRKFLNYSGIEIRYKFSKQKNLKCDTEYFNKINSEEKAYCKSSRN